MLPPLIVCELPVRSTIVFTPQIEGIEKLPDPDVLQTMYCVPDPLTVHCH